MDDITVDTALNSQNTTSAAPAASAGGISVAAASPSALDEITMPSPAATAVAESSLDGSFEPVEHLEKPIDLAEIAKLVPDKMAFKIGEVAEIVGLKTYVLRYWETEFDALSPQKSAFNQRMYTKKDVETVLLIKKLLYDEKFSIAGAKRKIRELKKELKVEKQWVEVHDRMEKVSLYAEELAGEIEGLRRLFA